MRATDPQQIASARAERRTRLAAYMVEAGLSSTRALDVLRRDTIDAHRLTLSERVLIDCHPKAEYIQRRYAEH